MRTKFHYQTAVASHMTTPQICLDDTLACKHGFINSMSSPSMSPCAGHSLNLVGVKAAECCLQTENSLTLFSVCIPFLLLLLIDGIYWHHLWKGFCGQASVWHTMVSTFWWRHFDAGHALYGGFEKIKHALDSVSADNEQEVNTRREAEGLSKKMENLETIFLTILWNDMLERMNKTSKVLQSKDVNILVATNLLGSMKTYLQETRDKFSEHDFQAWSVCPDTHYKARSVCPDTHYCDEKKTGTKMKCVSYKIWWIIISSRRGTSQ